MSFRNNQQNGLKNNDMMSLNRELNIIKSVEWIRCSLSIDDSIFDEFTSGVELAIYRLINTCTTL